MLTILQSSNVASFLTVAVMTVDAIIMSAVVCLQVA